MRVQPAPSSGSPHQSESYNTPAPPPPPKPLTHSNGTGSPHAGARPPPPLPPIPGRDPLSDDGPGYRPRNDGIQPGGPLKAGQGRGGLEEILQSPLPNPPDERWLPDNLRDKSYDCTLSLFCLTSYQSPHTSVAIFDASPRLRNLKLILTLGRIEYQTSKPSSKQPPSSPPS